MTEEEDDLFSGVIERLQNQVAASQKQLADAHANHKEVQEKWDGAIEGVLEVLSGLMLSDHLGDVHDQINRLCDLFDLDHLEGDYETGWTQNDCEMVGIDWEDRDESY